MLFIDVAKRIGNIDITARLDMADLGIVSLFGPSGAGKTTIVNMTAGLIPPDQGVIRLHEAVLFDSGKKINLKPEQRRIGYIFQDGRLFPHLSVRSNLQYGFKLLAPEERLIDFDQVVEVLDIGKLLHRRPHHLSGGEKQRVAIGRALLISPRLLLMDEPLTSVDNHRKWEVLALVEKIPQKFKIPILYVSHAVEEIERIADAVVPVKEGRTGALESRKTFSENAHRAERC